MAPLSRGGQANSEVSGLEEADEVKSQAQPNEQCPAADLNNALRIFCHVAGSSALDASADPASTFNAWCSTPTGPLRARWQSCHSMQGANLASRARLRPATIRPPSRSSVLKSGRGHEPQQVSGKGTRTPKLDRQLQQGTREKCRSPTRVIRIDGDDLAKRTLRSFPISWPTQNACSASTLAASQPLTGTGLNAAMTALAIKVWPRSRHRCAPGAATRR